MAMKDMALSAEEAKEYEGGITSVDAPKYPYGLRINLNDGDLEKLGLTTLPAVGTKITFTAVSEVCSTGQYQDQGGEKETSLSLQITAMEIGQSQQSGDAATLLYGSD